MCSEDWTRSQQGVETPCHKAASQEAKQRPGHVHAPGQAMRIWKDSLAPKGPMLAVDHTYTRVERAFLAPQSTKGKLLDANQQDSWQPQASPSNWGRGPEQRGVKQQPIQTLVKQEADCRAAGCSVCPFCHGWQMLGVHDSQPYPKYYICIQGLVATILLY